MLFNRKKSNSLQKYEHQDSVIEAENEMSDEVLSIQQQEGPVGK